MPPKPLAREPGDPAVAVADGADGRVGKSKDTKPTMDDRGKSDGPVLPMKRPNKDGTRTRRGDGVPYTGTKVETPETAKGRPQAVAAPVTPPAEAVEGRGPTEGNRRPHNTPRTQGRTSVHQARARIREAARTDTRLRFTTLLHHIYTVAALREAYARLKPKAAPGVDGVTWQAYGEHLEDHLRGLSDRLKCGAYRAKPVRRTYIPKADGRQRPLGITALEDKIVQQATAAVLHTIYETDFLGFSYGFRPGRGPHDALDALYVGIRRGKVNYVLDADIRGFFDAINHAWLVTFLEHRIADTRVVRLIQRWLRAGVLEGDTRIVTEVGTPQGGNNTPRTQKVTSIFIDLIGGTGRASAAPWRRFRGDGDAVADHDRVVTDEDLLDHEAHNPLSLLDVQGVSRDAHPGKKRGQRLGQAQLCGAVAGLLDERVHLRVVVHGLDMHVLVDQFDGLGSEAVPQQSSGVRHRPHRFVDLHQPAIVGLVLIQNRVWKTPPRVV